MHNLHREGDVLGMMSWDWVALTQEKGFRFNFDSVYSDNSIYQVSFAFALRRS